MNRLLAVTFALCFTSIATAATPQELFNQANDAFARATAQRQSDPAAAQDAYTQATSLYRQLIQEHGIVNPELYFNLANAFALSGDVGRAIINYRRALRLAPSDPDILANYNATRARVATAFDQSKTDQLKRSLLAWHAEIPPRMRLMVAVAAFGSLWLVLGLRLSPRLRPRVHWIIPATLFVVSATAIFSLWSQEQGWRANPQAVVVVDAVVGRKGPDAGGYEPSFTRPLSAGVEVTILERRPGWALVRLADARETWLPEGSWEEV